MCTQGEGVYELVFFLFFVVSSLISVMILRAYALAATG